jgi:hypothetical protein
MWDLDSYTKQQYEVPWEPLVVDWVHAYSNRTYSHYADGRHATEAITSDSIKFISAHAKRQEFETNPLFLYVAYTAAHSPLQPMPRHESQCSHIPHLWRRQYCGMVMGLDEGILNITEAIKDKLGENTLLYVFSDNGGSTWFGGLNVPLRGSKSTALEGGVRVPAFIVDYTPDQRYIGQISPPLPSTHSHPLPHTTTQQSHPSSPSPSSSSSSSSSSSREYWGLMHSSDIMPTLLSYTGLTAEELRLVSPDMDGMDISQSIRSGANDSPRTEMLLELYESNETIFVDEFVRCYVMGDMKLLEGVLRDPLYYYESTIDRMNTTDITNTATYGEYAIRFLEWIFGPGPFDNTRITITHLLLHTHILKPQLQGLEPIVRLYNLTQDPTESSNIASLHMDIVDTIRKKIHNIQVKRPYQQPYWMQYHLQTEWPQTLVSGDCSKHPSISPSHCLFAHPWLPDDVDPWKDLARLTHSREYAEQRSVYVLWVLVVYPLIGLGLLASAGVALCGVWKMSEAVALSTSDATERSLGGQKEKTS